MNSRSAPASRILACSCADDAMPAAPPLIVPDMNRPGALLPPLSMRLPADVVADLDGHAARLGCSRVALSRALLAQGVAQLRDALPA